MKGKRTNKAWPRRIVDGSITIPIYEVKHPTNRSGFAYVVTYSTPNGTKRQKFADPDKAIEEARIIASKLAAGRIEGSEMSVGERDEYLAAKRIAGNHPLISALEEWAKAKEMCGADLLIAAKAWQDANGQGRKEITVAEAVKGFLRDRKRSGVDTKAGYARTLPRVAASFGETPIHTLTATHLKEWLHAEFKQKGQDHVHPSTFNSHRKRMATLWKWCRDEGFLPKNAQTEIEQVKTIREKSLEIGILKVSECAAILALIRKDRPACLAAVVLGAFAGLRRSEIHAQAWDGIDLSRGILSVTKAKQNTPSKRIVHLCPAAVQWLRVCPRDGELIAPSWGIDRLRALVIKSKISCPNNCFRHSFITYRVAATGNVEETSLEAGTSPTLVFKHYREVVGKDEGKAWFELTPKAVALMATSEHLRVAVS